MKKVLLTILATLSIGLLLPATAFAHSTSPSETVIGGHVKYESSGKSAKYATVSVTCNGNTQTTTADKWGFYSVTYKPSSACPVGSSVTVVAKTSDGESGSSQGKVYNAFCNFDVGIINVTVALPEMGIATGSVATLTAGGAFLVIRRRSFAKE